MAMTAGEWVNETLYAEWGQRFLVKRELARVKSEFQDILVFESHTHGRVMTLDGVVQITEATSSSTRRCSPMCRCWRMARRGAC
jgi:spermidine synthase